MVKIHYRTHTGSDDRYHIISRTVATHHPYFETMRVLNLGPDENRNPYTELLAKHKHFSVLNFQNHYTLCITSDIIRHHLHDIPDGEWLCFLDSDWRLPQSTLDDMHKELELAELEGFNAVFSYQLGHTLRKFNHHAFVDPNRTDGVDNNWVIQNSIKHWTNSPDSPDSYGWPLFIRVDKKNMWYDSWHENHGYVLPVPYKKKSIPSLYYLHLRDFNEAEYCKTMIYQCWWYLGHHVFSKEEQYKIINSVEYELIGRFKKEHRCYTSNHLFQKIHNESGFIEKLRELFLLFKDTEIFSCKQMYKMATDIGMDFSKTIPEPTCSGICCHYKYE